MREGARKGGMVFRSGEHICETNGTRFYGRRIHDRLMHEQQKELDNLRKWLTLTEDRISRLSERVGPDINALRSQLESLRDLQTDLQNQQKNVDLLSNLVVIVDEGTNENGECGPGSYSSSSSSCRGGGVQ